MLHLGYGRSVSTDTLVMIVNRRGMTADTKRYLDTLSANGRTHECDGAAQSYALTHENGATRAYASVIAPATLEKRANRKTTFAACAKTADGDVYGNQRKIGKDR